MSKFKLGDIMKNKYDINRSGCIKAVIEKSNDSTPSYSYLVFNESSKRYFLDEEGSLELIKETSAENDSDKIKEHRELLESYNPKSDLKVGDVVKFRSALPIYNYAVVAVYETTYGEDMWQYDLINIDKTSEYCTAGRLMLDLQYHDKKWEEYAESVENNLPAWRGKLYNYYIEEDNDEKHNDDTIPLAYMFHIINDHTVANRFGLISQIKGCKKEIEELLKVKTEVERNKFRSKLRDKLISYDKLDTDIHHPGRLAKQSNTWFSMEEEDYIDIVDKYDPKDLYPFRMTSLQIMHAIQEAYNNAYKVDRTKGQVGKDERTGEHHAPNKGQRIYRGESQTYHMTIEFWFDLDLKIITTAYPVIFGGIRSKKKNDD